MWLSRSQDLLLYSSAQPLPKLGLLILWRYSNVYGSPSCNYLIFSHFLSLCHLPMLPPFSFPPLLSSTCVFPVPLSPRVLLSLISLWFLGFCSKKLIPKAFSTQPITPFFYFTHQVVTVDYVCLPTTFFIGLLTRKKRVLVRLLENKYNNKSKKKHCNTYFQRSKVNHVPKRFTLIPKEFHFKLVN